MDYNGYRKKDKFILHYIRNIQYHPFKSNLISYLTERFFKGKILLKSTNGSLIGLSHDEFIGNKVIEKGKFEADSIKRCVDILKYGGVFIDIGANQGLFSVYLSQNKLVKSYAFEPSHDNFKKLLFNISLNSSLNITPINLALGDKEGFAYLNNLTPKDSGSFRVVNQYNKASRPIKIVKLADMLSRFNITQVKLIKIDVEGYEMNVFKGLFEFSDLRPEHIIMKLSNLIERMGYTKPQYMEYFKSLGYNAFDIFGEPFIIRDNFSEAYIWFKLNKIA